MTATEGPAAPPLRIGLVTPAWPGSATPNGIASATAHLAAGLQSIGQETTILTQRIDGPSDHPRVIELPQQSASLTDKLLYRLAPDRAIRRMTLARLISSARQAIERHRLQVIMIEESFGWCGPLRRALSIPVVATLHGPHWLHRMTPGAPKSGPDARRERWEAAGLREVDGIISPSRNVLDRTRTEWGLPNLPTAVIGNPVHIPPIPEAAALQSAPHLLFVGRFDRIKGADVLLTAFSRIAAAHPACRLTFVGPDSGVAQPDGPTRHLPEALAQLPAQVRDRIDILGPRSREEILAIRQRHPITLITSRYETFGVALIEAMAAGSAVVSTRVGGCAEILRDGETGLLVPSEDAGALAEACLRLLADPALTAQLGQAARRDVVARFAPEVIAREVVTFLAPLLRA